jgi:hypothetical protein
MATSLAQKLRIKEKDLICPVNEPANYKKHLGPLPKNAGLVADPTEANHIHWFVTNRAEMEKGLNGMLKKLSEGVLLWIFYPKGTSGIQTDLTRDKGWDELLKRDNLQWISLIAFDDTWSTFACRLKTETDKKKEAKPKEREIFNWIDPAKKIVRLPEDFSAVLKKNKKQEAFFNSLSFTNRKEYVEWIVTAKRPETRADRVKESVARLAKDWKNPRNL